MERKIPLKSIFIPKPIAPTMLCKIYDKTNPKNKETSINGKRTSSLPSFSPLSNKNKMEVKKCRLCNDEITNCSIYDICDTCYDEIR